MSKTDVLIMAAGSGERFGGEPKQFLALYGKPVIVWAVARFALHPGIDGITVVSTPGHEDQVRGVIEAHSLPKIDGVIAGGETRQDSVRNGLASLDSFSDSVLVHDAARPCLSRELLQRILEALTTVDAVVPSLPVVDTLIRERSNKVGGIVDRAGVSGVQTPQGFRTDLLRRAHENAVEKGIKSSDDGSLVVALGETVTTVPGERTNVKITFEDDIAMAEAILGGTA